MELEVLLPRIFAGVFLVVDMAMFIRMIHLVKKSKDDTAENLGNKLKPLLYATAVVSVLIAVCMIIL